MIVSHKEICPKSLRSYENYVFCLEKEINVLLSVIFMSSTNLLSEFFAISIKFTLNIFLK